jgi:hypothetical protein
MSFKTHSCIFHREIYNCESRKVCCIFSGTDCHWKIYNLSGVLCSYHLSHIFGIKVVQMLSLQEVAMVKISELVKPTATHEELFQILGNLSFCFENHFKK